MLIGTDGRKTGRGAGRGAGRGTGAGGRGVGRGGTTEVPEVLPVADPLPVVRSRGVLELPEVGGRGGRVVAPVVVRGVGGRVFPEVAGRGVGGRGVVGTGGRVVEPEVPMEFPEVWVTPVD